ncbi:MAG: hypothetical protein GTN99_07020, partial [Candidatus Dadabacteria bacterium]|nr:hypothetical protein [Candidatus Dadabacteria bacterium]
MGISLVGGRYVGPIGYSNFMQNNSGLNDRISSLQNQISALQATPSFGFGASGLMPQNLPIDPFNQGIYGLSQGQMPQFNPMAISPYLSQFMSPQFNIP